MSSIRMVLDTTFTGSTVSVPFGGSVNMYTCPAGCVIVGTVVFLAANAGLINASVEGNTVATIYASGGQAVASNGFPDHATPLAFGSLTSLPIVLGPGQTISLRSSSPYGTTGTAYFQGSIYRML